MFGRAVFEVVEVKGVKEFLNFGASKLIKIFLPNTFGLPILSSFDHYIDFKSAVYK